MRRVPALLADTAPTPCAASRGRAHRVRIPPGFRSSVHSDVTSATVPGPHPNGREGLRKLGNAQTGASWHVRYPGRAGRGGSAPLGCERASLHNVRGILQQRAVVLPKSVLNYLSRTPVGQWRSDISVAAGAVLGQGRGDRDVLAVVGLEEAEGVRAVQGWREEGARSPVVVHALRGADPRGLPDRPPVWGAFVCEPTAPGSGDSPREQRPQEATHALPGRPRLHAREHPDAAR